MKKGFTLVELLAVITLLGILVIIIFPTVLEMIDKKTAQIDEEKINLIYSSADTYMRNNINDYPAYEGNVYCISVKKLSDEQLIPFETDDNILYADNNKTENIVRIAIGANNKNAYQIVKNGECTVKK